MQSRTLRRATACLVAGASLLAAAPSASADIADERVKHVALRVLVRVERYDDYCEHRRTIDADDTYESIAQHAYGDRKRAAEIAAANPGIAGTPLPLHALVVIPPKRAPPADAKETLAWAFWGFSRLGECFPLQRVYPDEAFDPGCNLFHLIAVPADRVAEFEKLIAVVKQEELKKDRLIGEEVLARAPWAIDVNGIRLDNSAPDSSAAVERRFVFRLVDAIAATTGVRGEVVPGRVTFVRVTDELLDREGHVVKAGFDVLFTWRGVPLGLIALLGAAGLARMRRRCAARS